MCHVTPVNMESWVLSSNGSRGIKFKLTSSGARLWTCFPQAWNRVPIGCKQNSYVLNFECLGDSGGLYKHRTECLFCKQNIAFFGIVFTDRQLYL